MIRILAAAWLSCVVPASAEFRLTELRWSPARYTVEVDKAPAVTERGTPVVPAGTRMTIKAVKAKENFTVFLVTPAAQLEYQAEGSWQGRLDSPGGYRVQFGDEDRPETLTQLDLIVSPGMSP